MTVEPQRVEIPLHDLSRIVVQRTKGGLYLELYQPGTLRDGHGLLKGSALVSEETQAQLRELLVEAA